MATVINIRVCTSMGKIWGKYGEALGERWESVGNELGDSWDVSEM